MLSIICFVVVTAAEDTTSLLQKVNVHRHDPLFEKADALFDGALDKIDVHDPVKQALIMRMTQAQGWIGLVQKAKTLPTSAKRELLTAVANLPEVQNLMSQEDLGLLQNAVASRDTEVSLQSKDDNIDDGKGDAENAASGKDGGNEDAENAVNGKDVTRTTTTTTTTTTIPIESRPETLAAIKGLKACGLDGAIEDTHPNTWWMNTCESEGWELGKVGCFSGTVNQTTSEEIGNYSRVHCSATADCPGDLPWRCRIIWPSYGMCKEEWFPNCTTHQAVGCHDPVSNLTDCKSWPHEKCDQGWDKCLLEGYPWTTDWMYTGGYNTR